MFALVAVGARGSKTFVTCYESGCAAYSYDGKKLWELPLLLAAARWDEYVFAYPNLYMYAVEFASEDGRRKPASMKHLPGNYYIPLCRGKVLVVGDSVAMRDEGTELPLGASDLDWPIADACESCKCAVIGRGAALYVDVLGGGGGMFLGCELSECGLVWAAVCGDGEALAVFSDSSHATVKTGEGDGGAPYTGAAYSRPPTVPVL